MIGAPSPPAPRFDWRFLLPLLVAATLNPMNSAMLATVLVPIGRDFPAMPGLSAWLIATLYLTAAVAQPVLGGVADRIGARRTLLGSLAILAIGAILGGFASHPWVLVASRAMIGVGTSAGFPCAVVMIRMRASLLGVEPPARLLGWLALAGSASMAFGPPLGGILAGYLGWRWVFLINLPLAIASAVLVLAFSPSDRRQERASGIRFDVPGILLFTLAISALMVVLMNLASGIQLGMLSVTIVLLTALGIIERRSKHPFVDVRLMATNPALAGTYCQHVLLNFVLYCLFYSIPQWSQAWLHLPVAQSGFILLPVAVSSGLASILPTRGRAGRAAEIAGVLSLIVTSAALMLLGPGTSMAGLMLLTFLFGIGNGALNMANQQRMLDQSPPGQSGAAAGLLRTSQYFGAILSAPLTAYLLAGHLGDEPMRTLAALLVPLSLLLLLPMYLRSRPTRSP